MKINHKISLTLLLNLLWFVAFAQKPDTIIKGTDPNSIEMHRSKGTQSKLVLKNQVIDYGIHSKYLSAKISPDGLKAVLIENYKDEEELSNRNLVVYDNNGAVINSIPTPSNVLIFLNNKGWVMTGFDKSRTEKEERNTEIFIFDETGQNQTKQVCKFFMPPLYYFSSNKKIIVACGTEYKESVKNIDDNIVYIFNDDFTILGKCKLKSGFQITVKKIDEINSNIYIRIIDGDFKNIKRNTIIIDYTGKILERREGWSE